MFSNRITVVDVRTAFAAYAADLKRLGVDVSKLELQTGTSTYGRAYRVFNDGGEAPGTGDRGYVGFTAREAYETLTTIRRTIAAMADLLSA